jgi:hypothetical protein
MPPRRDLLLLLSLPPEIFRLITSFLEPSDLTCLGLTCTGCWLLVTDATLRGFRFKHKRCLKQRKGLLERLASDSADMVYCGDCLNLKQLDCDRALTMSNNGITSPCHHFASHVSICKHFSITREMLELVLKFPKYQMKFRSRPVYPPHPLSHTCTWRTSGSCSAEFTLSASSKVIDGALHLKIAYDIDVKVYTRNTFSIPSMRGKGCLHSGMWLKKKCTCALQHALKGEAPCSGCSRAQGCAYCYTQFLISAEQKSASSLHLQVRVYRYLGGGQGGGALSEHVWVAQTRPLAVAKDKNIRFSANDCSLETLFEHSWVAELVSYPVMSNETQRAELVSYPVMRSGTQKEARNWVTELASHPVIRHNAQREVSQSFAARAAHHEKYWRPPP